MQLGKFCNLQASASVRETNKHVENAARMAGSMQAHDNMSHTVKDSSTVVVAIVILFVQISMLSLRLDVTFKCTLQIA